MSERETTDDLYRLLPIRRGHFRFESGHHGDLWLDLELLCLRPQAVQRLATQLAGRLSAYRIEMVCGPLVEGAFVALMVALELGIAFTYAERIEEPQPCNQANANRNTALFPVPYRLPRGLREVVRGK
jgi:orotate phosphoribosyltransferase